MRASLQPGYVLHSRPYRDSSSLLEVFTAEHGRLSVLAKGARRQGRRAGSSALLQPFTPLLLSFSGRSELKTLTATEAAGKPFPLRGEQLYSGLYMNELLVRLLQRFDPHARLFAAYGDGLQRLGEEVAPAPELRAFELLLLEELGYSFSLSHEGHSGDPIRPGVWYRYETGRGLNALAAEERGALPGEHLLAMSCGNFGGAVGPTAKLLLRRALREHLGSEPLRSRELFLRGGRRVRNTTSAETHAAEPGT